ncbi:COG5377 Phage-related protein, predicted endonuclease [uncultured Caudovirales phage]|uniref:COG5377 Phage-related protein, predicted endonuclease n=1 Tax=uncultured Caudovirales phage TaxID=2100421 RepID=A0A6J5MG58_9CAUD|nr:COG5377 Phage-related protein, predicted endonuclease [uncultured Caudovirales phage]CAB4189251.1 COG5377 Phage-related protein, predicted endonuclease [uncultured Caudovirales phage]
MSKQYEFVKAEQRSPEWFALRADGITATDVSVIAGLNPYKTPYQLWAEKLGKFTPDPVGPAAVRGILLENAVAEFYEMETGRELRRSNGIVRLKELPWVMASLDRTIVGEEGLVEIKTSTSPRWSLHPVPPEVVAQVQWQMFVTGAPWCDIAVLLGGLVFRIERVLADVNYQTQLYAKAVEFRNLLATDTPPTLQGEDSDALAQVVPQTSEEWAQADLSLDRLAALYAEKQYESKLLEQELQNLAISLKEAIGEKVGIVGEGWSATWKQNKSSQKIDYKLLLEALKPSVDVVDAYTREVPGARVFKFKTEEGA